MTRVVRVLPVYRQALAPITAGDDDDDAASEIWLRVDQARLERLVLDFGDRT
jgi:hypothetical protein